jgi:Kef-type K+ transport system membrane component KefB
MIDAASVMPRMVFALGILVFISVILKELLKRTVFPALAVYLMLGLVVAGIEEQFHLLGEGGMQILEFLGLVGVFALLFKTGLDADPGRILGKIQQAKYIWFGNLFFSLLAGFSMSFWILGLGFAVSLFVGVALSATSIGVSVACWEDADAMDNDTADIVLGVAEMDDVSGVLLMVALFAIAPELQQEIDAGILASAGKSLGLEVLIFSVFVVGCLLFTRYLEPRLTHFCQWLSTENPDPMLMVTAVGMCIAALAGIGGFSVAIGAFLAGLSFSRDPDAVKTEKSFQSLYDLFVPFFFISIGARIDPGSIVGGLGIGGALVIAAVVGKFVGTYLPARLFLERRASVLLAISMIPHAEITMIVAAKGMTLGENTMTDSVFSAIVFMVVVTSIATPLMLAPLIDRWVGETDNRQEDA